MTTLTIPVEFEDENGQLLTPQLYIPLIPDKVDIMGVVFQVKETRYLTDAGCYRIVVKDVVDERTATASNAKAGESRNARGKSGN